MAEAVRSKKQKSKQSGKSQHARKKLPKELDKEIHSSSSGTTVSPFQQNEAEESPQDKVNFKENLQDEQEFTDIPLGDSESLSAKDEKNDLSSMPSSVIKDDRLKDSIIVASMNGEESTSATQPVCQDIMFIEQGGTKNEDSISGHLNISDVEISILEDEKRTNAIQVQFSEIKLHPQNVKCQTPKADFEVSSNSAVICPSLCFSASGKTLAQKNDCESLVDLNFTPGPMLGSMEVIRSRQKTPAVLALSEQENTASLIPVEHVKADKTHQSLYPQLSHLQTSCRAFTKEQLRLWEPGSWLENVDHHLLQFMALAHQEGHELYELLMNYWRCRKQLCQAQAELQATSSDCKSAQNRLWTFRDEQLTLQGVCADQAKVCGYHRFQKVLLNESVVLEIKKLFETKAELLHQTLALHSYTVVLSRLQIESFLYRLLNSIPPARKVAIKDYTAESPDMESQSCLLQPLKESISVLFCFTRRVLDDCQFQADIHLWLQKLVAILQCIGSTGDQLFLLNHILHCPSGIGKWAAPFLQIKVLNNSSGVYHFMQALAILMSPVKNRDDFMCYMKPTKLKNESASSFGKESGNWTLVDEGGEEDEDPETSWMLLAEDDLITLFCQFPFDQLFKHLLGIGSKGTYKPKATSSQKMMKIFAFASNLVELLAVGLTTYNRARYRQFVKRIGHMIRMTLCYVSDHWAQYVNGVDICKTMLEVQSFSMEKLQVEFDELFLKAVLHVLKAKRLGIWLFMSEMPYGTLSSEMLWKIFYIMQCTENDNLERLSTNLNPCDCIHRLKDPEEQSKFQCCLSEMNSSDGICLLTTFAHMAQPKRTSADPEFVRTIVLQIYEVCYVSLSTRETFSKVGKELLAAIAIAHPHIISVLLEQVSKTIEKVGMVSLYLFKDLPLYLWTPAASEIALIRQWLLDYNLSAVENKLACIILEGLNWGVNEQTGDLVLDPLLHSEVALLVVEAYQKFLTDKPYSGIISESIKQVSYLASVVQLSQNPETSFNQWAWDLVLRLKLHSNDRWPQNVWSPIPSISAVPEIAEAPSFHPLLKAVKARIPIGCYLALNMTSLGHSLDQFCQEGVGLLKVLVQSRYLRYVVHILKNLLPLAYPCQYYLLKSEEFLSTIHLFLHIDSGTQGMTQQVTHKVTQHLTKASFGENIKYLNSVIQAHVSESSLSGRVGPAAVLEFWAQILTDQHGWHRDKTFLYLLDHLCRAAFLYQQEECLHKLLYQQHKNALGYHGDRGIFSSVINWIWAGNVTPSFIEGSSLSAEVWFSWIVLNMESIFEEDSQLRHCMEQELLANPCITPDHALKKAQSRLKLPIVPSLSRLMIYRWAYQALATPADHPLLPLIWQRFFQLYLRQPGPEFGLEAKGCIGRRYFHSSAHLNLLKDMRHRLTEVADFHHAASKALKVHRDLEHSDEERNLETPTREHMTSPQLHEELVRLFQVFSIWLGDDNLQRQEVYLPSLPKQYDAHRLAKVMQKQDLWIEYIDIKRVQHELKELLSVWTNGCLEPAFIHNNSVSIFTDFINPQAAQERILTNLKKHDCSQPPLPLVPMKAPVQSISISMMSDEKALRKLVHQNLTMLQQQAKLATLWEFQQVALDSELLDTLPQLYSNREEQLSVQLECHGSGGRSCQGPAIVNAKFEGMHKHEAVQNQIQSLKRDIKLLQADATKPPPQSVAEAAVHVENLITTLVNTYKLQYTALLQKVGISAFYQVVSFVCDDTQRHPPTRQFFSFCIEMLGQVFIRDTSFECKKMLATILCSRHLCNLLSPYFTPNACPADFVSLYDEVVQALCSDSNDVIFMLLTKFDLENWLTSSQPPFTERSRLMELIHQALIVCGLKPEEDVLMPFNIFCKHWVKLLRFQFPDHYSDFLRLLMQSSAEQLISPDVWKSSLSAIGCCALTKHKSSKSLLPLEKDSRNILSSQQIKETIEWLSDFLLNLRLSNADFRSFSLFSKWGPYMEEVKTFWFYLIKQLIEITFTDVSKEPVGSSLILQTIRALHNKIVGLFQPWILVLDTGDANNPRCYPWMETDSAVAASMVTMFTELIDMLHEKFKDKLLPGQQGTMWLHLMHYCETCTASKMPEYILYTYHKIYSKLQWKDLHPDQALMEQFFKVERGSPKSCFLFLGTVLCEVNWVSVLRDALNPHPYPDSQLMVVYLLYLMTFLAKEDELISKPESPLLSLLGQSTSIPWNYVDIASFQNILGYVNSHYPPAIIIKKDSSSELTVKLLKMAAGFDAGEKIPHQHMTLKCQAFLHLVVEFLCALDQSGSISLVALDKEMESLLENMILFNPPETDLQQRHMAICGLFSEILKLLNTASISTSEALQNSLRKWVERKARSPLVMPLLTAACRSLASVQHMAHITEACIFAYFTDATCHDQYSGWGSILVSLQVPELTAEEFLKQCLTLGSYLTLYVYILQLLNLEQTLTCEKRCLILLRTWMEEVFPSNASDESKLFLWWHKALELVLIQAEQPDVCGLRHLLQTLLALQTRLSLLGEERLASGILGAIGLGRKSPLSSRFRVVARSMSTFLLVQVPSEERLRLQPGTDLQLTPKAQQALDVLESMPSNKQYADFQQSISHATQFIRHPGHCLQDGTRLLALLINSLYPDIYYLNIIR
ncbi:ectopic P granules protein 5 homolog [Polypterus senegalus]|uniref:ectopic P granules protein 5 homolog n=1 Tax=Polypterus senegalus TaxID=55291 RepID=UPI0019630349|nr:ectopic P granules protein 5 homolog [Polypterus senegalus]